MFIRILILFFIERSLISKGSFAKDDVSLIIDVRSLYGTSSVIFLHKGTGYEDMKVMSLIHGWSRDFSRRGIMVLDFIFLRVFLSRRYFNSIVRPLFVVILTSQEDVEEFAKAFETYDIDFGAWLVLFWQFPPTQVNFFCKNPEGNPFGLRFNTEMIVSCEDEDILREWYAVLDNRTEVSDLVTWGPTEHFAFLNNNSRGIYERRRNMYGRTLRAVVVKGGSFAEMKNGELDGSFGIITRELSELVHFSLVVVKEVSEYGGWDWKSDKWSGAIGEIVEERADIGIGDFSMTNNRLSVVDFTMPLVMSANCIYYKEPSIFGIKWSSYFEVFKMDVWLSIVALVITTPLLLAYMESHKRQSDIDLTRLTSDIYLNVWAIFCQQGVAELPKSYSLRLAYFSMRLAAFSASTYYSACLISFLMVPTITYPFTSLEGFANDGTYKFVVLRDSSDYDMFHYSNDALAKRMMSLMIPYHTLPRNHIEGFKMLCSKRVAFYTSEEVRKSINSEIPCKITTINAGRVDSLAMILSKRNQFTGLINHHLQKFLNNGMLPRLINARIENKFPLEARNYQEVEILNITPILAILIGGIFTGVAIFLAENYVYQKYRKGNERKRKWSARRQKSILNHRQFISLM